MKNAIRVEMQWAASGALSERVAAGFRVPQGEAWHPAETGRRDQRALRVQAMIALAVAWSDPCLRQRWRGSGR